MKAQPTLVAKQLSRVGNRLRHLVAFGVAALFAFVSISATAQDAVVPLDFTTISQAVVQAEDIDGNGVVEIFVQAGLYEEIVVIRRSNLTLTGEDPATTTVQGFGSFATIIARDASNVTITGFTATGDGTGVGLRLEDATNCVIRGNVATGNRYGILIRDTIGSVVSDNESFGNRHSGLKVRGGHGNVLTGNSSHDNLRQGIDFERSVGNLFDSNVVSDNGGNGIRVRSALASNTVSNNLAERNLQNGIFLREVVDTIVVDNVVRDGQTNGIRTRETTSSVISGNEVTGNLLFGLRYRNAEGDDFDAAQPGIQGPTGANDFSGNTRGPVRDDDA